MQENEVLLIFNYCYAMKCRYITCFRDASCNSTKLHAYLRQAVADTCDDAQFSALTRDASCRDDEHISKCVRRLLTRMHPQTSCRTNCNRAGRVSSKRSPKLTRSSKAALRLIPHSHAQDEKTQKTRTTQSQSHVRNTSSPHIYVIS